LEDFDFDRARGFWSSVKALSRQVLGRSLLALRKMSLSGQGLKNNVVMNAFRLNTWRMLTVAWVGVCLAPQGLRADPLVRLGSGAGAGDISAVVDQFRLDLGGVNNGVGGTFTSGFRAINWDGVPDSRSSPNLLPGDFFNVTSPRGVVFDTPGSGFQVSASLSSGVVPRFGNIDASYANTFSTFSSERLFAPMLSTVTEVRFFLPGQGVSAFVGGFGVVFTDVDRADSTSIQFLDVDGNEIFSAFAPVSPNGGLSFLGVSGLEGVFSARIISGNAALGSGILDDASNDLVVMDDFIYGEPVMVPEPSTWAMLGCGLLAWLAFARRRRA